MLISSCFDRPFLPLGDGAADPRNKFLFDEIAKQIFKILFVSLGQNWVVSYNVNTGNIKILKIKGFTFFINNEMFEAKS